MKRKMYRIELREANAITNEIAILAALSNGGKYFSIGELDSLARANYARYSSQGTTVFLIGNDLLIDKGTENLLHITEVEIMDLPTPEMTPEQAKEFLEGMQEAPTLSRTGINDKGNMEALN